jgi:peroxiredoxin
MRADIVAGALFPDYELTDHAGKRRKLSELQGPAPMVLVLSRAAYCPKDLRQAEGLVHYTKTTVPKMGGTNPEPGKEGAS